MDDPVRGRGRRFRIRFVHQPRRVAIPPFGSFGYHEPDINSPRVQTWNVTFERQIGANWGWRAATSAPTPIGCGRRRLLNPGFYMGLGPCTLADGKFLSVCSTERQPELRGRCYQENPRKRALIGTLGY
jgi:hypothetical protein